MTCSAVQYTNISYRFCKKNCNIGYAKHQKIKSKYRNIDIDYDIGQYSSEIELSGLEIGYFVDFVPSKNRKKSKLFYKYSQILIKSSLPYFAKVRLLSGLNFLWPCV